MNRLTHVLPEYEHRPAQEEMARDVEASFSSQSIALIEAGTGIGKSMAYLIPAIQSALRDQKRTVISTHTINLQEQLLEKDIPLALKALEADVQATLVKGMNNYVCLRRVEDDEIAAWAQTTSDGSRSDLPFTPKKDQWDRVKAEGDACTHNQCPHYNACFFFRARRQVEESQLLIVNHHLLLSDLNLKAKGESGILPKYDHLIIDEAHHLEEVATKIWATQLSRAELVRLLTRSEEKLKDIDLLSQKRELVVKANEIFYHYGQMCEEGSLRVREEHLNHPEWAGGTEELCNEINRYAQSIRSIDQTDLQAISGRLEEFAINLDAFANQESEEGRVRWIEMGITNIRLIVAHLDVSDLLWTRLFSSIPSVVLTSATMTAAGSFSYLKRRLGLADQEVMESIYDSPFAFDKQGLFLVPTDLPSPTHPSFTGQAAEAIFEIIQASRGNTFVLFTSFQMMRACKSLLAEKLENLRYPLLIQGDKDRSSLLKQFAKTDRSVLFGTSSFWEGVDVAGDRLRCVILAKLPFKVPTEPITQARYDAISSEGKSPFTAYAIPEAIMKFKQGAGRLIRSATDRGCVVCLDSRLKTKPYGRLFLKSIPPFRQSFTTLAALGPSIRSFLSN